MRQCVSPSISQFYYQTETNGLEGGEKLSDETNQCSNRRPLTNLRSGVYGLTLKHSGTHQTDAPIFSTHTLLLQLNFSAYTTLVDHSQSSLNQWPGI